MDSSASNNKIGSFDPGWNDPPNMSYNPNSGQLKPRNLLNKRVPFPLDGVKPTSAMPPFNPEPCPTSAFGVSPLVSNLSCDLKNEIVNIDSAKTLSEVMNNLTQVMDNNRELGEKLDTVKKRLKIMESLWKEDKFNSEIQRRMLQLSKALLENRPESAEEMQKSLMVDYVSLVSTWMVGLRQLINYLIAKKDLMKVEENSSCNSEEK